MKNKKIKNSKKAKLLEVNKLKKKVDIKSTVIDKTIQSEQNNVINDIVISHLPETKSDTEQETLTSFKNLNQPEIESKKVVENQTTNSKKTKFRLDFNFNPKKIINTQLNKLREKLSQKQKILVALISTILIVLFLIGLSWFINEVYKQNFVNQQKIEQDTLVLSEVDELNNILASANVNNLVWNEVKLSELKIYPNAWVEANFNESERNNPSFSGPEADADGDGLINRLEYLLGANPRNKFTLCAQNDQNQNQVCTKTDKQLYDEGISPLTGIKAEQEPVFRVLRTTQNFAENMNNAFDKGYREGTDFPTLYQKSATIDLTSELEKIEISVVENNRETLIVYIETKDKIINRLTQASSLTSFWDVYKLSERSNLEALLNEYNTIYDQLVKMSVPKQEQKYHQALSFFVSRVANLAQYRLDTFDLSLAELQKETRNVDKGIELMWAYRQMLKAREVTIAT